MVLPFSADCGVRVAHHRHTAASSQRSRLEVLDALRWQSMGQSPAPGREHMDINHRVAGLSQPSENRRSRRRVGAQQGRGLGWQRERATFYGFTHALFTLMGAHCSYSTYAVGTLKYRPALCTRARFVLEAPKYDLGNACELNLEQGTVGKLETSAFQRHLGRGPTLRR